MLTLTALTTNDAPGVIEKLLERFTLIAMPHPAYWALHHHAARHGCFVATASFGTPLEPEVMLLKDFRDRFLMTKTIGRLFVQIYYRTSPPIAHLISRSERLKRITRELLKPLVRYARKALLV